MSAETTTTRSHAGPAILWGGLACGVLDLVFAVVYYGIKGATVSGILHTIAGGVLGRDLARQGGWISAAAGLGLHFVISFGAATVFWLASRRCAFLVKNWLAAGLGYGVVVYFAMNWVVVPLSALSGGRYPPTVDMIGLIGHMFVVGLPIAGAVRFCGTEKGAV